MLLALCDVLNMIFDTFGINSWFISMIGGVSLLPLLFLYLTSYVFRFCKYHRMFLHYVLVATVISYIDYYIGLPFDNVSMFIIYMIIVGIFLFLVLYYYRKEKCCKA